jgi:ferredoxin/flavodoxin---NADP+ reductase
VLRVAVVGSGPSGVYTAAALIAQQALPDVAVDVLDQLPCPYGLVRYGVAPDHAKIKSLQGNLRRVLQDPRIRFLGNVRVDGSPGTVGTAELRGLYHAVVYCVGAATDRRLGIPGEDLPGSCSATGFVSWYSAHPDEPADRFAPLDARSAVVVGVGNVALDVARILARGAEELRHTDVPERALRAIRDSRVTDVHVVGRRGPSQAKFTTKELRELGDLPGADVVVRPDELDLDPAYRNPADLPAATRRNVEVLRAWAARPVRDRPRRIHLRFFLRPTQILGEDRATAVRLERTAPDGRGGVTGTGRYEEIPAQLVLRSVGYRGVALPGLPFEEDRGVVPNEEGRVLREGAPSPGEYVAGWIKRGPTGVIGSNRPCAKQTAQALLADASGLLARPLAGDPVDGLRALGLEPVEWAGWEAIEAAEAELGRALDRTTVKIPDWAGLLAAARPHG